MTAEYKIGYLIDMSEAEEDSEYWVSDGDDPDRFCGDAVWEFSKEAMIWETRRQNLADQQIKEDNEEGALLAIKLLFKRAEQDIFKIETILYIKFLFIQ